MAFSQLTGNVTLIGDPLTVDATWDCDGFQGTIRFHPKDDEVMTDRWKVYVDTREGRPQLVQCVKEAVQAPQDAVRIAVSTEQYRLFYERFGKE